MILLIYAIIFIIEIVSFILYNVFHGKSSKRVKIIFEYFCSSAFSLYIIYSIFMLIYECCNSRYYSFFITIPFLIGTILLAVTLCIKNLSQKIVKIFNVIINISFILWIALNFEVLIGGIWYLKEENISYAKRSEVIEMVPSYEKESGNIDYYLYITSDKKYCYKFITETGEVGSWVLDGNKEYVEVIENNKYMYNAKIEVYNEFGKNLYDFKIVKRQKYYIYIPEGYVLY